MNANERKAALRQFSRSLQDKPLDPSKPEDQKLYVPGLHQEALPGGASAHVTDSPVDMLAAQIDRSEGSRVWLFTGNIGTGKSTELNRLRTSLQHSQCVVMLVDASESINMRQRIDISDFLISLTAAFARAAGELLQDDTLERGYWERTKNFLNRTNIKVSQASVALGLPEGFGQELMHGNLALALQRDPTVKQLLQTHLKGHLSSLSTELQEFRAEILDRLHDRFGEDAKLVLVVDSLERLRGSGNANDEVFASVRDMFQSFPDELRLEGLQVVYTVAPYLVKLAPQLPALLRADSVCHLASAHIYLHNSRDPDPKGLARVRQIISSRYPAWQALLSQAVLDQLILHSGGDLRDLFRLINIYLLALEFSQDEQAVLEYTLEQVRRDMTWVVQSQLHIMQQVAKHHQLPEQLDEAERDEVVHCLETKRILMYRNGSDWYDVHPLLRDMVKDAPASAPVPTPDPAPSLSAKAS